MTLSERELGSSRLVGDEFLVVGVGASAGGVEALEAMFSCMPEQPGFAIVVVQHLSPNFESLMPQIISRRTKMPVTSAEHGVAIVPNHVYVLPAGKELRIENGQVQLSDRELGNPVSVTINRFFKSLASDCGSRGVAIVLSGTGRDGSEGVIDVHEAGGFVIVQSEDSAKFNGMPRAAVDSGIADVVTSVDEIPGVLTRLNQALHGTDVDASLLATIEDQASRVLQLLRKRYSIDFSHYKSAMFNRRLERRLMLDDESLHDIRGYVTRVEEDPEELNQLFSDLLIGVTEFFRDPEAFEILRRDLLPNALRENAESGTFRVWVAPTATGEEAYSVAMMIDEVMQELELSLEVKIFATDAHRPSIEFASRGIYPEERLGNVNETRRKRYFKANEDGYHVCRHIRKMVVFAEHNVLSDAPFTGLDLVCCRNLLIYLKPPAQRRVLSLFNFGLKDSALLFLGPSESILDLKHEFGAINEKWRMYRKSASVRPSQLNLEISRGTRNDSSPTSAEPMSTSGLFDTYDQLIDDFLPPSLLVTSDHQVAHVFSGASKFLSVREGRPSTNVLEMLPDALRVAVANGIKRGESEASPSVYAGLQCEIAGENRTFKVTIKPIRNRRTRTTEYLISLVDSAVELATESVMEMDAGTANIERVQTLEVELRDTRESLHASIQELKTANEEMQSTNEELIASNEELQSTNEELHSVNEELYTVNSEHQRKIAELTELTDDMENLLDSIRVDTIFLDKHLKLRKFTLGIARTFRLIPQDVGRRIDSFNHDLKHEGLVEDIQGVLDSETSLEKEVQDTTGSWYLMRLLPYTSRGRVDGVLLTLIDITPMKMAEQKLAELSEIVEVSDDAIFKVDNAGMIRTWNRGAEALYAHTASEVIGEKFGILLANESDQDTLRLALSHVAGGNPAQHVYMTHVRRTGEQIEVAITISPIVGLLGETSGASIVIRDISAQTRAQEEVQDAVKRRDEFLAMLSHELRNPLAAIRNADSLLREKDLDIETAVEARDVVQSQLRHLTRLLDDLLDVSRITNDKLMLQLEVVDLRKSMMEATECVQHHIDSKAQQLFVEAPGEPVFVLGDVGRLQQAQVNLLVNACKYTPQGGSIRFELTQVDNDAVLSVIDDGIGVAPDLAQTIFELFVQSEQSLDRSQGGMGLGLPLVKMIAGAHGGTVTLESRGSNLGSVFQMRLPITTQTPAELESPRKASLTEKRLLLIEDNDGIRTMLARSLQLKGLEVAAACDAKEGLEKVVEFEPEIAVVDIGLPDIDGYEIARRVRKLPSGQDILMIAVTGYGREEDKQKAMSAGFDSHMVKPVDPSELIARLASLTSERALA